jgi:alcohol dehydrogenase
MRALVYDNQTHLDHHYPMPFPKPGEALIRVKVAGICNTDLEIIRGYMGFRGVLGHEFVGQVEACADAKWLGKRVVGEINCYCGDCDYCRQGLTTHCPSRSTLGIWNRDGALAEYCALPMRNLHIVPEEISDQEAVFTEPLAAALEIMEQAHIKPSERVVVLGDGKLGLLVSQVLSLSGCDLSCFGHHEPKLALLRQLGIDARLVGKTTTEKADCVIDCTGQADGFAQARALVRPRGRLVLKSTYHSQLTADLTGLVVDEIALLGSRCGPFAPALRLLKRHLAQVSPLTDSVFALTDGLAALERARQKGALKVLVRMA